MENNKQMPSPPSIQQEAEKPNLEDTIQWMSHQAMKNMSEAEDDARSYYEAYLDALTELRKEMEITKSAPAQQEAIPEAGAVYVAWLIEFRKSLKARSDAAYRESQSGVSFGRNLVGFADGLTWAMRQVDGLLEKEPPSPPSVKTGREEDKWKFHCWKEFGGGERCDKLCGTCSGEDFVQPSPIVQEGEPEDLKDWMDNHAECDSDEDATLWINGAKAMYRKLADDNVFYDSQIADYSKQLAEEIQSLQSQLSAIKKERDDYRKALEEWQGIDARNPSAVLKMAETHLKTHSLLLKYPIPQTPTNE